MYSNGMLLKEISDCIESFELLVNFAMSNPAAQVGLSEDDLNDCRGQLNSLKRCDSLMLLKKLRRHSRTGKLTTIVHGELWDRNLMVKENQVKILDWKNAKLGSATLDLAFFMLSSTTWQVRDQSTTDLLKTYYDAFCDTCSQLGVCQKDQPSFYELKEDYEISLQVAALQVNLFAVLSLYHF